MFELPDAFPGQPDQRRRRRPPRKARGRRSRTASTRWCAPARPAPPVGRPARWAGGRAPTLSTSAPGHRDRQGISPVRPLRHRRQPLTDSDTRVGPHPHQVRAPDLRVGPEPPPRPAPAHRGWTAQRLLDVVLRFPHAEKIVVGPRGQADGRSRVAASTASDELADPPHAVGGEPEALVVIELLDRPNEPQVALLHQIQQRAGRRPGSAWRTETQPSEGWRSRTAPPPPARLAPTARQRGASAAVSAEWRPRESRRSPAPRGRPAIDRASTCSPAGVSSGCWPISSR